MTEGFEDDTYSPPRPGAASHPDEHEAAKKAAAAEVPDPGSRLGFAHYSDMEADEAAAVFKRETLCVSCLCVSVCRVAAGVEEPLVVVSRCLAYLPVGG